MLRWLRRLTVSRQPAPVPAPGFPLSPLAPGLPVLSASAPGPPVRRPQAPRTPTLTRPPRPRPRTPAPRRPAPKRPIQRHTPRRPAPRRPARRRPAFRRPAPERPAPRRPGNWGPALRPWTMNKMAVKGEAWLQRRTSRTTSMRSRPWSLKDSPSRVSPLLAVPLQLFLCSGTLVRLQLVVPGSHLNFLFQRTPCAACRGCACRPLSSPNWLLQKEHAGERAGWLLILRRGHK
mmetsp:Transcript_110266/g.307253  ORF Transcript_110266/g.307253 Transcript_110266/m.307253 type:complete len:233 (+) Transcript_110266:302-1000(+)